MTLNTVLAIPALLGALLLTACGDKTDKATDAAAPAEVVQEAAPATPAAVEPAAPAVAEAGGYTPSADELVPGVTMTPEEVDKQFAEGRANTPIATVPGDEPVPTTPVEATPATPAEAAPVQ